jgi:predicted permease
VANLLAVATLIWYAGGRQPAARRLRVLATALFTNPLILACAAGFVWSRTVNAFPVFVENTLELCSLVTLPLALLSVGGGLTFGRLRRHLGPALAAAGIKLLLLPSVGYLLLRHFGIGGAVMQTAMILLALPISPATYVLAAQLDSDTTLASAIIVVTTLLSFFSLSAVLVLFF